MKKNIILCGFMGSGKSTVGRLLAEKMGMRFIDTDTYIEQKEGMTISEIFARKGENYFRDLEASACRDLSNVHAAVISTGGGTLLKDCNVTELKKSGIIFLLDISPETVLYRLRNDKTRPLLQREDKENAVRTMLSNRIPLYKKAADCVINGEESPLQICFKIINLYN